MKLNAKRLRISEPTEVDIAKVKRRQIYIICDNILDTYNIGSIFRLADAIGASCVYLCGESETPPNIKIHRAAVGTDKWVPWEYASTAVEAISNLRSKFSPRSNNKKSVIASEAKQSQKKIATGSSNPRNDRDWLKVVAIEQTKKSKDFREVEYKEPIAFVVGYETSGVSKETLAVCDEVVEIPMYGVNVSLNVMVSLAIILYQVN
ncbi:MAG: TrmH family RNA methyltransferase [Candidatus Curtissbacteria bacterium]|nr:TrmH family RNA methyltransferase [Candidatus Curtissbacteria bacterium]